MCYSTSRVAGGAIPMCYSTGHVARRDIPMCYSTSHVAGGARTIALVPYGSVL